ncbi:MULTISPECIES: sulfate ABC transporter permease subunit CysW [Acinetobacter]|uniref:Sulfate ABC transporter permease subunit CysW n=1 Tax=Acinetobacter pollinis TaxID=2605270 RepID=A0ABU6DRL7_9GAMM|nr:MULTISPECIES: sulfate ABC transporter permease subunit CysW [Acinetobacter]MBF7689387.1 sulfate ABC transporter permease subunit CysW [Acinetobacter pollinis]MBF7692034.1 sulfate ABC transporter permease subunit CysW [Acinetobacter pollinis]MBF7697018.1 sulfate ABC transporter permease subunit CysW [Acinetobacter pollinis]MBF7700409.1 sulfate ABC transporter permease subunit CysW [Acinetobacter pollinis]MEB5476091.1 sulfate ABC transporter permease subunit CysW [Acinetobacter pollinis]
MSHPHSLAKQLQSKDATREPSWVRYLLLTLAFIVFLGLLILPLGLVFIEAFKQGVGVYFNALIDSDTRSAVKLTLITALIAVPLNVIFGVAAAWAVAKFNFKGKTLLTTLIDTPFSVSPVIAGLMLVLIFGTQGWLGEWLQDHNMQILYSTPAIILATVFITVPFVARELIPLMQAQGNDEEEAAILLGASGWTTFWKITLPNIKWGLLYGIILCNARAMGEFGAVSVVSGHIRGQTNTLPLHVEILYNDYSYSAAFAVASLLAFLAILTLIIKTWVEVRQENNSSTH